MGYLNRIENKNKLKNIIHFNKNDNTMTDPLHCFICLQNFRSKKYTHKFIGTGVETTIKRDTLQPSVPLQEYAKR